VKAALVENERWSSRSKTSKSARRASHASRGVSLDRSLAPHLPKAFKDKNNREPTPLNLFSENLFHSSCDENMVNTI
jgi:hypothetical protein